MPSDLIRVGIGGLWLACALGSSDPAASQDWKDEANARIEQIRKRDVEIYVADEYGAPISAAPVDATQTRHHFAFGSEIGFALVENPTYREFFFDHFEWAVFGNETKWFYNEPIRDFETYSRAEAMYDLCEQHGVPVRGHCLFWAKERFVPGWARNLPDDELREEVDERIDSAVTRFKDRFRHWDVNNEMLDGHFFEQRLGPEIRPHMFQRSHDIDPYSKLFVNDYSIIAGSSSRTNSYIQQIRGLIEAGAPIHAIGVQGHFWGDTVDPVTILARLDQLSVLDLPIWVTEYDAVDADDQRRADKLENCYRAAFSHRSVDGILMWGFWAGAHWRGPDAAIVDLDWTLNAAGERYEALIDEWTTHEQGETDAAGRFVFRGFHGTYQISVEAGEPEPLRAGLELFPGEGPASFLIPLVPGSCFAAREVENLRLEHDADSGLTTLRWKPIPARQDMASTYDTLRSTDASSFDAGAFCLEADDGADAAASDADEPFSGAAFFYAVRGAYDCPQGEGPLGARSDGTPRDARACP
ncbi:MAG: endo-1,4-beta-xylanase [Acidobacteriota bacterium]|nr:MAG: endo-1,4-beta-xylanase [Acidobacteriota bacterium]